MIWLNSLAAGKHLETAQSILYSALHWGNIGRIALKARISPSYLSRLQRPGAKPPSPKVAERIAKNLPLSIEQQQDLVEQWHLAAQNEAAIAQFVRQDREWLGNWAIGELTRLHQLAAFSKTPQETQHYYKGIVKLGEALIWEFHVAGYWLAEALAHTLLHDAFCVFNRPGAGLYHAKMARTLLDYGGTSLDCGRELIFHNFLVGQEQALDYYELQVNAIRSEAVSYNLLGFYQKAEVLCDLALQNEAVKIKPAFWKAQIVRDKLNALNQDSSADVGDITRWAANGCSVCEDRNDDLGLLLIHNAVAQGYLLRDQVNKAERILNQELMHLSQFDDIGLLHKAMLFSNLAALYYRQGNIAEWSLYVTKALTIAYTADLKRLICELSQEYLTELAYREIQEQVISELKIVSLPKTR